MRRISSAFLCVAAIVAVCPAGAQAFVTHGPFLGHQDHEWTYVWARMSEPGRYRIVATKAGDAQPSRVLMSQADAENDNCILWSIALPEPDSTYTYTIMSGAETLVEGPQYAFDTPPPLDAPQVATLGVGSCANDKRFPDQPVWRAMRNAGAQGVVLLGDTPYIDSTDLSVQRERYREFYEQKDIREHLPRVPLWATWDDHDFGSNNTDGNLEGKENARKAFGEYHALRRIGLSDEGIFTSFRRGPMEFFLLDTRWAAGTEDSMWEAGKPTLLGGAQWQWLTKALKESSAPFKLICSGMVWNDAVPENKNDCWARYPHERDALFRFLGIQKITGVVLLSGDIHWSRAVRHEVADLAGYDITEIITSPLANTLIESYDVPAPEVLHSAGDENSFLLLTADTTGDTATLNADCRTAAGESLFTVKFAPNELMPVDE